MPKLSETFLNLLGKTFDAVPPEKRQELDNQRLAALAHFSNSYDIRPVPQTGKPTNLNDMVDTMPEQGIPVPGMEGYQAIQKPNVIPTFVQDANGNITPGPSITTPRGTKPIITKPTTAYPGGVKPQMRQNAFTGQWEWYQPPTPQSPSASPDSPMLGQPVRPVLESGSPDGSGLQGLPFKEQAKLNKEKPRAFGSLQNTMREYDNMIKEAEAVRDDSSLDYATGMLSPLGSVPGIGAKRVSARLDTLKAKTLLNVLSSLKQLSANGSSGFGQLSDTEGKAIQGSVSTLDRKVGTKDFKDSLNRFIDEMKSRKGVLKNTFKDTYGNIKGLDTPDNSATQLGETMRVRNKQTGQTGSIPSANFDSNKYDQI